MHVRMGRGLTMRPLMLVAVLLVLGGCANAPPPPYLCAPVEHEGRSMLACLPYTEGTGK